MRIALISPLMEAVPPSTYGGTERVVAALADALTIRGHQVTVFASAESCVNADLVACRDQSIVSDRGRTAYIPDHIVMLERVRQVADQFDVLHFHTEFLHFPMFHDIAWKTLTTCHSRLDLVGLPEFFKLYEQFPLVSISDAQRCPIPCANWQATIRHGYPLELFRALPALPAKTGDRYVAFLGRISPDKGIDRAIEISRRTGIKLKIAARINTKDRLYWERTIKPLVDRQHVEYVGEIGDAQKTEFLSGAVALLFPIRWPEPFGLVMIEAMACGTPVIAFPYGAVPEVVEDGVTGRLVNDVDAAVAALPEVAALDRHVIRQRFETRFSSALMAKQYESVYRSLVDAKHYQHLHHELPRHPVRPNVRAPVRRIS